MATEAQVIEYLRKLSQYRERPECDSDGMPHYVDSGNMDDAYGIGETDGGINLAKALIDALTHAKNVYPSSGLHPCGQLEPPPFVLGRTALGSADQTPVS